MTDFVDWKVEKRQQGKICSPVGFSDALILVFYLKMSQTNTEYDKSSWIFQFAKFYATFFSNFWQTLWIGTLKKVNKERTCSPVGFSDGLISVFQVKISQSTTDYDKIHQIFQVSKFLCIFFKFLTDFVDWNNEKSQQGKNVLSSRLFWCVNFSFLSENVSNYNRQKSPKISNFQRFYAFCFKFLTDFVNWNIEKGQQRKNV